jgi:hypothetical protein
VEQRMFIAQSDGLIEIRLGHVSARFQVRKGDGVFVRPATDTELTLGDSAIRPAILFTPPKPKCSVCADSGFAVPGIVYCECALGRALQHAAVAEF